MMKILHSLKNESIEHVTAVTVGKFDGIHKGHELLMQKLRDKKSEGFDALVLTFDISPRIQLKKDLEKQLITNEERRALLEKEKIDYLAECSFENEIMSMEPEEFIRLLVDNYQMKYLVCGTDFHFGRMGKGDIYLLEKLAVQYDFSLEVIPKLQQEHRDISSTFVREEIVQGNVSKGNELLGYEYFIWGEIVHGNHLGTKMGIPTINMIPPKDKLIPANGVYVTRVEIDGKLYYGVTNVGVKPTINGERAVGVETHILNFSEDVYSRKARVIFLERLREEKRFDSVEQLVNQMQMDIKTARKCLNIT